MKKIIVLDDGGAYGVGMADAFAAQAAKKGMAVVIRDRLDPLNADYTAILTKAKSLGTQALYYGGDPLAGAQGGEAVLRDPAGYPEGRRRRRAHAGHADRRRHAGDPGLVRDIGRRARAGDAELQAWAKGYKAKTGK